MNQPVFTHVSEKNKENIEQLRRQARSEIQPGTCGVLVFMTEQLGHWWGDDHSLSCENLNKVSKLSIKQETKKRHTIFIFARRKSIDFHGMWMAAFQFSV